MKSSDQSKRLWEKKKKLEKWANDMNWPITEWKMQNFIKIFKAYSISLQIKE